MLVTQQSSEDFGESRRLPPDFIFVQDHFRQTNGLT